MSDLPAEIKVWFSRYPIDYMGTWATTRYPAEAVTYVPKADAEAAVALALEEAADLHAKLWRETSAYKESQIRALAPASGVAKLAALRAERDEWKAVSETLSEMQAGEYKRADTLAAELASLKAREEGVAMALKGYRATFCHASPGSDTEFALFLEGFDAAADIARGALAQTPTDPGDGWTWNERLGWIGPDGKPADPRRGK